MERLYRAETAAISTTRTSSETVAFPDGNPLRAPGFTDEVLPNDFRRFAGLLAAATSATGCFAITLVAIERRGPHKAAPSSQYRGHLPMAF